jgi:hypothetical protein
MLTSGTYVSAAVALANGSASFNLPAGTLPQGSDTLSAAYTPDAASAATYNGNTGTAWVTVTAPVYTLTIDSASPASGVPIAVAPADNNNATGGATSFTRSYYGGTAVTVTAPATAGGNPFVSWSGCTSASTIFCTVTMNANATVTAQYLTPKTTPAVTVTPSAAAITTAQALEVTAAVSGGSGNAAPTGTVVLSSGAYASAATTLANGSAKITLPAGSLATGSDVLKAAYTPDAASASAYNAATGTASVAVTIPVYTLNVDSVSPSSGVAIGVTPADNNNAAGGTTAFTRAYNGGSSVTLTAPATSGANSFVSWSGCGSASTVTCKVTMNANTTVTANYAPITYTLTVNSATPSSGVVIGVSPADNNNAAGGTTAFTRIYNAGSQVTLTAPATSGSSSFVSWSGCASASTVSCTVAMNANSAVTANYALIAYTLTVNSTDPASGVSIAATPADRNGSSAGTTPFLRSYNAGTAVTLTAPSTSGSYSFVSWSGCASASTVTCTVAMNTNITITATYAPITYTLTVNSAEPASGVAIGVSPADNSNATGGTTSFTRTYDTGTSVTLTAPAASGNYTFVSWSGCASASTVTCTVAMNANTAVTATYAPIPYKLTVNSTDPASGVAIGVSPADNNSAAGGTTSFSRTYNAGSSVTLTAPATSGAVPFLSWTGCTAATTVTCTVTIGGNATVTANYGKITPTVAVTPSLSSITTLQDLTVPVAVSGGSGHAAPSGSVQLTSGSYTSAATPLSNGSASIDIPAGSLATGSDTLTAAYTPDAASSAIYLSATGTSSAVTVVEASSITVDQSSAGVAVTSKLMGMNMAAWVDPTLPTIVPALEAAGIKTIRWPGGSWADNYHWATNTLCNGTPNSNATFANFIGSLVTPGDFDVALAVNYGTNASCSGPGDPTEAAAWAAYALAHGAHVSHITVGNEDYGSWETDMHSPQWDAATYAAATATGYYPDIKAADPNVLVGVSVNPGNTPEWDPIVLADAKYDFVEYHFYAQAPYQESDTYLVQKAAQNLTTNIEAIKTELATAGKPDTPIFIGEIGSVYTNPGKQTSSITQALYAGQVLGEMMNEGVSYATWWLGFGGCSDASGGNFSSSLYGWQNFGGYMVFSDGTPEYDCENATAVPAGTLLPTARAFQLFSNVAVDGENVLSANVVGDTTDVRAYAATHSGGTALVLFNLNETASEAVVVTLSGQSATAGGTVTTYSKAIYDQSKTNVWAAPTTATVSAQSLPLTLTLDPWSMNVVVLK